MLRFGHLQAEPDGFMPQYHAINHFVDFERLSQQLEYLIEKPGLQKKTPGTISLCQAFQIE